jgi:hypothetical protein
VGAGVGVPPRKEIQTMQDAALIHTLNTVSINFLEMLVDEDDLTPVGYIIEDGRITGFEE